MNTWVLLITENLAEILSLTLLISISIYLLRMKKNSLKDTLIWDIFLISISFLMTYIFLDIAVKNLLISDMLSLLRDFALMLGGVSFVFALYVCSNLSLDKRPLKREVKKK